MLGFCLGAFLILGPLAGCDGASRSGAFTVGAMTTGTGASCS